MIGLTWLVELNTSERKVGPEAFSLSSVLYEVIVNNTIHKL